MTAFHFIGGLPIKGNYLNTWDRDWSTYNIFQSSPLIYIVMPTIALSLWILAKIFLVFEFLNFFFFESNY